MIPQKSLMHPQKSPVHLQKSPMYPPKEPYDFTKEPYASAKEPWVSARIDIWNCLPGDARHHVAERARSNFSKVTSPLISTAEHDYRADFWEILQDASSEEEDGDACDEDGG